MNTSQASSLLLNQHKFSCRVLNWGPKKTGEISRVVVSFQDAESAESLSVPERPGLVFLKIVLLQIIPEPHLK